MAGIITRIVLGALAERYIPTRYLLPALGLVMSVATAAAANVGDKFEIATHRAVSNEVTIKPQLSATRTSDNGHGDTERRNDDCIAT